MLQVTVPPDSVPPPVADLKLDPGGTGAVITTPVASPPVFP
jgi:hypothetical protein